MSYNDKFLSFRSIVAAVAGYTQPIEIDTRLQTTSAIHRQIPVYSIAVIRRNAILCIRPQMTPGDIEHVQNNIQITPRPVMQNTERCRCSGRILRCLHVEEQRFQTFYKSTSCSVCPKLGTAIYVLRTTVREYYSLPFP